jgi:hypothetical protein
MYVFLELSLSIEVIQISLQDKWNILGADLCVIFAVNSGAIITEEKNGEDFSDVVSKLQNDKEPSQQALTSSSISDCIYPREEINKS